MRRYESYKDSGVEWLGGVPNHWEVKKMKFLFQDTSIKNKPDETLLSVTQNRGVIPRDWLEERTVMPSGSLETFKFIEKDDFAISLRSFEGGLEICHHDGIISPAYTVLKYNKKLLNNGYYKYLFKCQKFISEMQTSIVGIREGKNISYEELKYSFLPIPQTNEQQKISQFLDDKTAKIDQAVDLAEKQIALLKEHKQILIQNAVTRGLNPDVPLKDSGVEWIGQVPEHWEVMRLKFMLSEKLKYGANESAELDDPEQPRYIRITDIDEQGNLKNDTFKSLEFEKAKDYLLKLNDILLARSGATAGKSYIYKENLKNFACYAGYLIRVRLEQKKFNAKFVNYYFQSVGYWDWIKSVNIQATIQNVSAEKYNDFLLSVPNLQEQVTIVDYLDQKTAKIDQAIALKTAHIEKLKEYKSVLINDVVTGKVWVSV
ncbi:restriction endonuclease subunit S [Neisseria elongata]|uniref:restriction endonuclease subunit S n=1 Tax=Neisseria elongata TaxID=495 RepID=UPI00076A04FE|nr:restriction endonuclease subunit S [Neisseria elongata]